MDRSNLIILAVIALSVSNLFVGITSQNKLLILASAAISAALAVFYIARDLLASRTQHKVEAPEATSRLSALDERRPFPLWVFVAILFMVAPAVYVIVQNLTV